MHAQQYLDRHFANEKSDVNKLVRGSGTSAFTVRTRKRPIMTFFVLALREIDRVQDALALVFPHPVPPESPVEPIVCRTS